MDYGDKLPPSPQYIFTPPRRYIFTPPLTQRRAYALKPTGRGRSGLAAHSALSMVVSASGSSSWPRSAAFLRTTAKSPGVRAVTVPSDRGTVGGREW